MCVRAFFFIVNETKQTKLLNIFGRYEHLKCDLVNGTYVK